MNPELRQTLNTISRNFESANEAAQENIYTFTQLVIDPCVNGFRTAITDCTSACFPTRVDRLRRRRARSRGRSDLHFDFYDDWEDEEEATYGTATWGNDELDSLLAGRGNTTRQPGRQRGMSYGTRGRRPAHDPNEEDPTIIPSSSYLGFLERFKWRPGARGVRYKPSAADLQEHPGMFDHTEVEPLIEESEDDINVAANIKRHKRQRSDTQASRSTTNSLSSRGDLIMGDEEDDAQPLDDEFAVMLSKQTTNSSRRPGTSRKSTRSTSGKSSKSMQTKRSNSSKSLQAVQQSPILASTEVEPPSMATLRAEEDNLRYEQEMEIAQKREVAAQTAKSRGLDGLEQHAMGSVELKTPDDEVVAHELAETVQQEQEDSERRFGPESPLSSVAGYHADSETEPFPSFPTTPMHEHHEQRPP